MRLSSQGMGTERSLLSFTRWDTPTAELPCFRSETELLRSRDGCFRCKVLIPRGEKEQLSFRDGHRSILVRSISRQIAVPDSTHHGELLSS